MRGCFVAACTNRRVSASSEAVGWREGLCILAASVPPGVAWHRVLACQHMTNVGTRCVSRRQRTLRVAALKVSPHNACRVTTNVSASRHGERRTMAGDVRWRAPHLGKRRTWAGVARWQATHDGRRRTMAGDARWRVMCDSGRRVENRGVSCAIGRSPGVTRPPTVAFLAQRGPSSHVVRHVAWVDSEISPPTPPIVASRAAARAP